MKKAFGLILISSMTLLSGCISIQSFIAKRMGQQSGIYDNADYKEYQQYSSMSKLDDDGYYIEEYDTPVKPEQKIRVTFGQNNNLNIHYYSDPSCETLLDTSDCRLDPGDSLYATVVLKDDLFSSMYDFSDFRIYEYTEEGDKQWSSLEMRRNGDIYSLNIPEDYDICDISIEPVGEYQPRKITLESYYSDNGEKEEISGKWLVNDKEYTNGIAEISPVTSYIVSFEYDSEEYFYYSSQPDCFYANDSDGIIIFPQREANDSTEDYSVELRKYFAVDIVSDKDRTVSINGGDEEDVSANQELSIDHLKYGDTITIETNKEWGNLENQEALVLNSSEFRTPYFVYTMTVPEKGGEFTFDPKAYSYEHGTIVFTCMGRIITRPQKLAKGRKIYYEAASTDTGYWLSGKLSDHFIIVGEESETEETLNNIHFTKKIAVSVDLPQPEVGGTAVYKMNGRQIYASSVSTYSGEEISVELIPWEGWIIKDKNLTSSVSYRATEQSNQTININGVAINNIFKEDEEHKPKLSLILEKSVGELMEFSLSASGYSMDVEQYGGGWKVTDIFKKNSGKYNIITNTEYLVDGQPIGTDQPLQFTISNKAIRLGTAVRMEITLTEKDAKEKKTEIRYINDLSKSLEPIYIYSPGEIASSTIWYESISISIGIVNVEKYTKRTSSDNTRCYVSNGDTHQILQDGDLVESSQKVAVTISPAAGYYLSGKNVTNNIYSETMTYAEYLKRISKIQSEHKAIKYYIIQLDSSDEYAEYQYKLDDKIVSDRIFAKDGQKLQLTYEITHPSYMIAKSKDPVFYAEWVISKVKTTRSIVISAEMDGKIITKSSFNIETTKGE